MPPNPETPSPHEDEVLNSAHLLDEEERDPVKLYEIPAAPRRYVYLPWAIALAGGLAGVIGLVVGVGLGWARLNQSSLPNSLVGAGTATTALASKAPPATPTTQPLSAAPATQPARSDAETLFAAASRSVIRIDVKSEDGRRFAFGSGFFVSADGLAVTNFHVVRSAFDAVAVLADGRELPVEGVVAMSEERDLAVLKIKTHSQPTLELASGSPGIGATVYAIGNPRGLTNTLSEGLVSALRGEADRPSYIQTTAAISHGSSGGPLLNTQGRVLGVTTMNFLDSQNLNFAVPAWEVGDLLAHRHAPLALAGALGKPQRAKVFTLMKGIDKLILDHRLTEARDRLEELEQVCQDDPQYLLRVADVMLKLGQPAAAIPVLKGLVQEDPGENHGYVMLANAYLLTRDFKSAQAALNVGIKHSPDEVELHKALLTIYLAEQSSGVGPGNHTIEAAAQDMIRRAPNDPIGHLALGNIYRLDPAKRAEALSELQRALDLAPPRSPEATLTRIALRAAGAGTAGAVAAPGQTHGSGVALQSVRTRIMSQTHKIAQVTLVNRTNRPVILKKIVVDADHGLLPGEILNPGRPWVGYIDVADTPEQVTIYTSDGGSVFHLTTLKN